MLIGIVGLPNSTKTTVFNALTGHRVATTAFSTGGFGVNRAVVPVPDSRVDRLSEMFRPRKTTYAQVEYKDIAGLTKGLTAGGLAGEVLAAVSQTDALLHVVRAFEDPGVAHPEGGVRPERDVAILDSELILSDLILVEKRLGRLADTMRRPGAGADHQAHLAEQSLLAQLHDALSAEVPVRDLALAPEEWQVIRGFQLLSAKPMLIVLNVGDAVVDDPAAILPYDHRRSAVAAIRGGLEAELAELDEVHRRELMAAYGIAEPGLNRVVRLSYQLLGLQSFFTVGEDEVRAWTLPAGGKAVEAAGAIHSDLARGFIRAEVVAYDDLVAAASWAEARRLGQVRLEGRDYVVRDGDIVHVRFNV